MTRPNSSVIGSLRQWLWTGLIFLFQKFVCLVIGNVIKTELRVNGNNLRTTIFEKNNSKAIKNLEIGIFLSIVP